MSPVFEVLTAGVPGAVAIIRVTGSDTDQICQQLGLPSVRVGTCAVRRVLGVDEALVASTPDGLLIMPHGGRAIVGALVHGLLEIGLQPGTALTGSSSGGPWSERLEDTLAAAASPLAIDVLLDQPRRWAAWDGSSPLADADRLGRLLRPATVVAVGAPNIGKSSLLNRVAGASVALAFDRVGTTRDPVGVLVDMAGLVVRWLDTPGVDGARSRESELVRDACRTADLVLSCTDYHGEGGLDLDHPCMLNVRLRRDRGPEARGLAVSALEGTGIEELIISIRRSLLPDVVLQDPRPWAFWET